MNEPIQLRMNETIEDAIKDDVTSIGGPKQAAHHFFPDKTPDQGAAYIRAWSLPDRSERPEPSQLFLLIELARAKVGVSECARFMEQRLNCRMEWLNPEDEKARLQREFITAVEHLNTIQRRIEQNEQRPSLRAAQR